MEKTSLQLLLLVCLSIGRYSKASPLDTTKNTPSSPQSLENEGILTPDEYLPEENVENQKIYEGDIFLDDSTVDLLVHLKRRAVRSAISAPHRKWPDAKIPYVFGHVSRLVRNVVKHAIRAFEKHTCLRFVPRTNQKDYLYIMSVGKSCWSSIGRSGGKQRMSLGIGCERKGTAIHEMMHAIGFFHEQSRLDRDKYVTVYWGNVDKDQHFNFQKYNHGEADPLDLPYDYGSIMHYPKYAFSRNGYATLMPKNRNKNIGQRFALSKIDIKKINKFYSCPAKTAITTTTATTTTKQAMTELRTFNVHCRNRSLYCSVWAFVGYCKHPNSRYQNYMASNCRKSCKLC